MLIDRLLDPATLAEARDSRDPVEYHRGLRHDLRTPINAIKGYGEMLLEDVAESEEGLAGDLGKILEEATLLLERIDGLVRYAELDTEDVDATQIGDLVSGAPGPTVEALIRGIAPIDGEAVRTPTGIEGSRILVVDDNASNREVLSRRLQRQGHLVIQAEDGARALAMLAEQPVDLILLDQMMPGLSG